MVWQNMCHSENSVQMEVNFTLMSLLLAVFFHLRHCCFVQDSSEEASQKMQYTSVKMEEIARWTCT